MLGTLLVTMASAADLHVAAHTAEGVKGEATWPSNDKFNQKFGPGVVGKSSVTYVVTVMGAVWDASQQAYEVDFGLCVEWNRKGKPGRWCKKEDVMAPAEKNTITGSIKDKDKYSWSFDLWYTGDAPAPAPEPAPKPADE